MSRWLSCSRGHQWEAAENADQTNVTTFCPFCGLSVFTDDSQPPPTRSADQNDTTSPTILQFDPLSSESSTAGPNQLPPVLLEFEILEELGRGGMGIVYRARQHVDQQIVAIKVIRKDRLQHEEAVRRFRREAQATSRLSHPNIVQVHDFDHAGDTHFLVMEYVDGITLERYVEERGSMPIILACDFVRQAALGLQHAHEQALVHRDIKPSNLMVSPAPLSHDPLATLYRVKLLDLGVARVLQLGGQNPGESLSTLTQGGSVIGTVDYIAPEQLEDPHGADIRSDLYSLGCTFYFLLTGQVPFPGGSLISKLDKQRWNSPTPMAELRDEIPHAISKIVDRLMAKNPMERYQSPGELAEALTQLALDGYRDPIPPLIEFKERTRMNGHQDSVGTVCWSPDGLRIASGAKDCQMYLWDAATFQISRHFPRQPQEVRRIVFDPVENRLASASGLTIRLWDGSTGSELRRCSGHTGPIRTLIFSQDGKRLISGSDDKSIRLWEAHTGREVQRFHKHLAGITALAVIPESHLLLSASRDQTIRLWDLHSDQELRCYESHAGAVLDIALAPGGQRMVSAHFDTILRLWDVQSGAILGEFVGHKQMVSTLAITPDGQRLLSAGQDHTLRLWDMSLCRELTCITCHMGGINALSLAPDGRYVVTASSDQSMAVWQLPVF